MMRQIYIAGPFTAETPDQIERNIREAELCAEQLLELTDLAVPLIPHSIGRNLQHTKNAKFWYDATLQMLYRCDAILLLPAWRRSAGSLIEHSWALSNGVPIFLNPQACADALLYRNIPERMRAIIPPLPIDYLG